MGIITLAMASALQMNAIPAKPGVITVQNADGTEISARLVGDEFFHQYFTTDGYPMTMVDGNLYYCHITDNGDVVPSGIRAVDIESRDALAKQYLSGISLQGLEQRVEKLASKSPRRQIVSQMTSGPSNVRANAGGNDGPPYDRGYGLFPDLRFPAYGKQKAIVILVEYQDVKFTLSDPHDYFNRMLNQAGFNDYGGTGCANEYYKLNSENNFDCQFDVFGPITLANNRAYYGANDYSGNDVRPGHMVKEACDALDPDVDFKEYDRDGNGTVDNVFVFYAGMGEASGGPAESVWPHSWNMKSAGFPNLYYDGVLVYTYGCSNEWERNNRPDGVGTFIHEFSHVMGLPDLYATRYTGAFTPGSWSAMDYGPYNNDGMTPPLYSAFERYALGWMKPREIDRAINATLPPIINNVAGVIRTTDEKEFFLVENRQKTGWDTYIPGHGMLVWHVQYDDYTWNRNEVNNTPSHQYVDIEEADGTQSESSRDGDSFPGASNKTSFTSTTNPAMKMWNNTAIDYPITDIAENGGTITFKVLGGGAGIPAPETRPAANITPESFTARWTKKSGVDHLLSVFYLSNTNARQYLDGYQLLNAGQTSEWDVTGVEPGSTVYYTVTTTDGWEVSAESAPVKVVIPDLSIEHCVPQLVAINDVTGEGFTAEWNPVNDANAYLLSVYTKTPGETDSEGTDFTEGIQESLPDGWLSTSSNSYGMSGYCGAATPSLRMGKSADRLETSVYPEGIKEFSFWCRGNSTGADDEFRVYGLVDGQWVKVHTQKVSRTGQTIVVTDFPEGAVKARLEFLKTGKDGSLAVDDVKVTYYKNSNPVYVNGYKEKNVGNVLSSAVKGLKGETRYYIKLRATDGTKYSKYSEEKGVVTGSTGISSIAQEAVGMAVEGRTVICEGQNITVYDLAGRIVATGRGSVEVPAAGLYIVKADSGKAIRLIIK